MTLDEFKNVAKVINSLYSDNGKVVFDNKEKVIAWHSCFSDLPYDVVSAAVKNLAMTCKFAPKIPEIREECAELMNPPLLSEQEAWEMVRDGIRNGIYGAEEEFNKFPPEVQRAVVTPWALSEWAMLSGDEVDTVIQSQFKRSFRDSVERTAKDRVLGAIGTKAGAMKALAETVVEKLEDGNGKND